MSVELVDWSPWLEKSLTWIYAGRRGEREMGCAMRGTREEGAAEAAA